MKNARRRSEPAIASRGFDPRTSNLSRGFGPNHLSRGFDPRTIDREDAAGTRAPRKDIKRDDDDDGDADDDDDDADDDGDDDDDVFFSVLFCFRLFVYKKKT